MRKKDLGQYFTRNDIWLKPQIKDFMLNSGVSSVLDPFCGNGDLLKVARDLGFKNCVGYDIDSTLNWKINDSLKYIEKSIEKLISTANDILYDYREKTKDLLLCAFKGNQTDNSRRRRLDFATARAIMEEAVACV